MPYPGARRHRSATLEGAAYGVCVDLRSVVTANTRHLALRGDINHGTVRARRRDLIGLIRCGVGGRYFSLHHWGK